MDKFTIVIPVYNEAKSLKNSYTQNLYELKNKKFETIIVDDNSNDMTSKVLKKFKKRILSPHKKERRDLTKSCIMGSKKSKYNNIIVMDGDLQHKPLKKFLNVFSKFSPDIVVGTRDYLKKRNII